MRFKKKIENNFQESIIDNLLPIKQTKMSFITEMKEMPFIDAERSAVLRKELEFWTDMMSSGVPQLVGAIVKKTIFAINPYSFDENEVGEETALAMREWWGEKATGDEMKAILQTKMKIDGTPRNWSCGDMGSRWCDVIINRRLTRVAFISRKHDRFPDNAPPEKEYLIELDATASRVMTDAQIKKDKKKKVCAYCGEFGKMMKSACCAERYCDEECYKNGFKEHKEKCEIARNYKEDKKSGKIGDCCLCSGMYEMYGNNPEPLAEEGRCCNKCNVDVIKLRVEEGMVEFDEEIVEEEKAELID